MGFAQGSNKAAMQKSCDFPQSFTPSTLRPFIADNADYVN